jgi:hypothetical protein
MKRIFLLLALVTLVIWLARGAPPPNRRQLGTDWVITAKAAPLQQSCCANPAETDPHDECIAGTCMSVSGCGVSDCSNCGCDPDQEWACLESGGNWDSFLCSCSYECDPDGSQARNCENNGGDWDQSSCSCGPCQNPETYPIGPPSCTYYSYCDGWYYQDCEACFQRYQTVCHQEAIIDDWTEYTETCSEGDYCGDDCYDDPYCYCYYNYCS